jgi:hypothetical protein
MKILAASVVVGPLMLIGVLPAAAASLSNFSPTPIQLAAASVSTDDRDSYTQKVRDQMEEWRQKLQDFSERAKAKGQKEGDATENNLNTAWIKTESESQKLQAASAEDWDGAKASFEKASQELADAWDRVRPEDR